VTALRDFLYLDSERVRSLLAQIEGGVVEAVVQRITRTKEGRAGASFFRIFEAGGSLVSEKASEQTKTLQDALYLLFEEAASEAGVFADTDGLSVPEEWDSGAVHKKLREAELIRLTGPTRIFDSGHFRQRAESVGTFTRLLTEMIHSEDLSKIPEKQRERRLEQLAEQAFDADAGTLRGFRTVGEFIESFMRGQILVRQFPCGTEHPGFALVGTLLPRAGYLQEERDALFAKYGSGTAIWTLVAQVASIPKSSDGPTSPAFDAELLTGEGNAINRTQLEDFATQLLEYMEHIGIAEGPTYPSITVTPIAIYRDVPVGGGRSTS